MQATFDPCIKRNTTIKSEQERSCIKHKMASSTTTSEEKSNQGDGKYECNICFEQAKDAVVSLCGHLFCWPCIHKWMEARPNNPTCPVCKSVIHKDKVIPLYGRGSTDQKDPRETVPPRPQGQREEAPNREEVDGMQGINVSFGIGAFPFAMMGGPVFQLFGNNQGVRRPPVNPAQREQQQKIARLFITMAILTLILIIFS